MQCIEEKMWIELRAQSLEFGTSAESFSAGRSRFLGAKPLGRLDCVNNSGNGDVDQQAREKAALERALTFEAPRAGLD